MNMLKKFTHESWLRPKPAKTVRRRRRTVKVTSVSTGEVVGMYDTAKEAQKALSKLGLERCYDIYGMLDTGRLWYGYKAEWNVAGEFPGTVT